MVEDWTKNTSFINAYGENARNGIGYKFKFWWDKLRNLMLPANKMCPFKTEWKWVSSRSNGAETNPIIYW